MTSRQRVSLALSHQEPDRVPVDLGGASTNTGIAARAQEQLLRYLGMDAKPAEFSDFFQQLVVPDSRLLDRFGVDFFGFQPRPPDGWKLNIQEDQENFFYYDEWGLKCVMPKQGGYYFDHLERPLSDPDLCTDDVEHYAWPDPRDPGRSRGLAEDVREKFEHTDYALCLGTVGAGVLDQSIALRGYENFSMDLLANPDLAAAIMDRVVEFYIEYWDEILPVVGDYIQVVRMSDDLGVQNGPTMSPELYRAMIKPRQKEVFSFIRSRTKAKLYLHSCGSVREFLPDIVDLGVDILNPIQVSARGMDTKLLKDEHGDKLCFWGAIDTQHVLPFGSTGDVRAEVRRRISDLAPGGGYVLSQVHDLQANVPPENIVAMFSAARDFGRYPINCQEAGE